MINLINYFMKSFTKPIRFLFLSLFFLTPLIFTQSNSELFELPKMYFVYLITLLITTFHLINVLKKQTHLHKKTFLDIPLILFFISQTISTIYSIDPHTSFFGYYSRLNGGLLSLICYLLLYWILCVYIDSDFKKKIIKFSLLSGLFVSIFAIAEHFGIDKNLWVQDVQSRVFSTLGQPNWLAAYLCILLPFSIYEFFESIKLYGRGVTRPYLYMILTIIFYIAILFTKSKSGIIACLISITIYFLISLVKERSSALQNRGIWFQENKSFLLKTILLILIFVFLSLTINNPIKDTLLSFVETHHGASLQSVNNTQSPAPQTLESKILITKSENIRKIVWQGAINLWKKFPIFGTGTETFAYSYYWTRPIEHNLTSEWDFLYNKAHNEYINYLATTGAVGLATYSIIILTVLIFLIKEILKSPLLKEDTPSLSREEGFGLVVLSSYLSILITNFAGFSVVTTSVFFFLLPALLIPKYQETEKEISTVNKNSLVNGKV